MSALDKSVEPCITFVPTEEQETSRCDGCDQVNLLKVFVYKKEGKIPLRLRMCPECAP